jgi:hypothetical protein
MGLQEREYIGNGKPVTPFMKKKEYVKEQSSHSVPDNLRNLKINKPWWKFW